ncbi:MAG: hypothetical protein JWN20_1160 [Jatrophihabitantaceae bacterium]|nr:hypothetical protein [Jatrophihabitantaceae bacterium]
MLDVRRLATICVAGVAVAALASCGGGSSPKDDPSTSPSSSAPPPATSAAETTAAPAPTPAPAPPPAPAINPLTGVEGVPPGPVIAAKIDDTANARPQIGIEAADVVYVEQAEGGLTRLVGVYSSQKPEIGPVRSVRASDPELLAQYGPIAIVASGGAGHALEAVANSTLVNAQYSAVPDAYYRSTARSAPYNVITNLTTLSGIVQAGGAKDIGFRWAASDPRLAASPPAARVDTAVGSTHVAFIYDAGSNRFVREIDGRLQNAASGAPVATPNVLIQFCAVAADYEDVDVNGSPSSYTQTVGSGRALLLRDGHYIEGTWSRASLDAATTYSDAAGQPLLLAPGGVWVVLAGTDAPLSVS